MIDEIFEMIMKEARSRPGDNLQLKSFLLLLELLDMQLAAFNLGLYKPPVSHPKTDKAP